VWDCEKADEEDYAQDGDVYDFVDRVNSSNRFKMMEILHNNNYSAMEANADRCDNLEVTKFTKEESEVFDSLILDENGKPDKTFSRIAKALGKSVSAVLIHYYGSFKISEAYENMKRRQSEDSEWCSICDDGGDLILCDRCGRWYHSECIGLPKKNIPKGEWFCVDCARRGRKGEMKSTFNSHP
jgi:PHD-finger